MRLKKRIGKIHLWLGLSSGLVVFIVCVTGCLYAFIDEIKPLVYSDRMEVKVPSHGKKIPITILRERAQAAIGTEFPLVRALVYNVPDRSYAFMAYEQEKEKGLTYFSSVKYHYTVFVNPYSGNIIKIEDTKYEFFRMVFWLHWSLWLSTDIGQPIVGIGVINFVVMLITGLILWWPRNKAASKQRFSFRWKKETRWKRKNYDLHNILGFYSMIIILLIALTGLVWAFDWFSDSLQWMVNKGKSKDKEMSEKIVSDTTQLSVLNPTDSIFYANQSGHPTAHSFFVNFASGNKGPIGISTRFNKHAYYDSEYCLYDQYTGALLKTSNFDTKDAGEKLASLNYDIHVGGVLGFPGKVLAFLASLIGASLPVTGTLVWLGRRRKKAIELEKISVVPTGEQALTYDK
jgi:uncharacterized iron-regulated membrane protein